MKDTRIVDIDLVEPNPYQPRLEFDDEALMDLAQSIRENGLIQQSRFARWMEDIRLLQVSEDSVH